MIGGQRLALRVIHTVLPVAETRNAIIARSLCRIQSLNMTST